MVEVNSNINNEDLEYIKKQYFVMKDNLNKKNEELNRLKMELDNERREKVKLTKHLEETFNNFFMLFNTSPNAMLVHSNSKVILANEAALNILKMKQFEEILGRDVKDFLHEDYKEIVIDRVNCIMDGSEATDFIDEKLVRADGSVIDVEVATKGFNLNGKRYVQVVGRDITKRKMIENDLRKSKNKFRNLFNNINDAVFILKYSNDIQNEKFEEVNDVMCKRLGYTRAELLNMTIKDINRVENKDLGAFIYDSIKQKGSATFEAEHVTKDGRIIPVENNTIVFNLDGENVLLSVSRDISERKSALDVKRRMEEKSKLLSEAIEYEKLRAEFFANISHELRTPINVIYSSIQLLELKINSTNDENDKKIKNYINIMKQNCYRLIRIINNLIDVTKIDSGYFELQLENHDIVNVVENITLSVTEYTESKGIKLIFDTDMEEKIIACDNDKIERIILNLIANAVKFTDNGGIIKVNMKDGKDKLYISVKDTGIGIPKDKQKSIFDRFIQVDKSFARQREGSGIGLSLVKSLVEMHGGKISVISEEGEGSEFIVELPVKTIDKNESNLNTTEYDCNSNIQKVNIEFSDIYL